MGKYMCKVKVSSEDAVMDVSSAPSALFGVRTRARALALQRLQKQQAHGEEDAGGEYLELRSRRLKKLSQPLVPMRRKAAVAATVAAAKEEVDASYGENMLELEGMERNTRETTPSNLIINSQMISIPRTPRSTRRSCHSSRRRVKASPVRPAVPSSSSRELKEYFDAGQRRKQQAFIDKYNFDPVNECPLPGKYEWVKLD